MSDLVKRSDYTQQATESYARVATTPTVLGPVIQAFGLRVTPADFAQRVSASVPSNTVLIDISVTGSSQRESARLSNAVAEQLVKVSSRISPTGGSERLTLVQVEAARGE